VWRWLHLCRVVYSLVSMNSAKAFRRRAPGRRLNGGPEDDPNGRARILTGPVFEGARKAREAHRACASGSLAGYRAAISLPSRIGPLYGPPYGLFAPMLSRGF